MTKTKPYDAGAAAFIKQMEQGVQAEKTPGFIKGFFIGFLGWLLV